MFGMVGVWCRCIGITEFSGTLTWVWVRCCHRLDDGDDHFLRPNRRPCDAIAISSMSIIVRRTHRGEGLPMVILKRSLANFIVQRQLFQSCPLQNSSRTRHMFPRRSTTEPSEVFRCHHHHLIDDDHWVMTSRRWSSLELIDKFPIVIIHHDHYPGNRYSQINECQQSLSARSSSEVMIRHRSSSIMISIMIWRSTLMKINSSLISILHPESLISADDPNAWSKLLHQKFPLFGSRSGVVEYRDHLIMKSITNNQEKFVTDTKSCRDINPGRCPDNGSPSGGGGYPPPPPIRRGGYPPWSKLGGGGTPPSGLGSESSFLTNLKTWRNLTNFDETRNSRNFETWADLASFANSS